MRIFTVFLFLLIGIVIGSQFFPRRQNIEKKTIVTDTLTITKTDTIRYDRPVPYYVRSVDTLFERDTILIREQKNYSDTTYTAWISGYQPELDSIEVYPKAVTKLINTEVTRTIVKKPHWTISAGVGIGYTGRIKPYAGIQIGYVLWSK